MELKLEVMLSSSIKRKKPWPRFCWLGQEKESVFLLDDKRISEINMVSGSTKKRTPKLYPLLNRVVTMAASQNGVWLSGLLVSGELFLWNRDKDSLKTSATVPEVAQLINTVQGNGTRLSLHVSGDGMRVLLVALTGQVFLWECLDVRDLTGTQHGTARGNWTQVQPHEDAPLPSSRDKDASQHSIFVKTEAMGDTCLSAFVFISGDNLRTTFLKIQWGEVHVNIFGSLRYSIRWASKTYPLSRLTPPCKPVKSRGALLTAFSPDGHLLAIVLNQRDPRATQVLFVSIQNFVSISRGLGGCGSKKLDIPSKYIRSYWVGSLSWAPGGLFLACVLKRGSLLMLARLGGLLSLSSFGCNVDFGPAHFLPLHPLVTYRPPVSVRTGEASLSSSSMSMRDVLRQRYSVTWHPRLFYFIVSDGYMATILRVPETPSPALVIKDMLQNVSKKFELISQILDTSQIHARAWLEFVSCLNLGSIMEELRPIVPSVPNTTDYGQTVGSTLPMFLKDQGSMDDTRELPHKIQACLENDSDVDGLPGGFHVEDGGHLEFASMFDTLYAQSDAESEPGLTLNPDPKKNSYCVESERKTPMVLCELGQIQGSLLTAWALGLSLGGAVEKRERLLKYTLHCVIRFAALLHFIPASMIYREKKNISLSSCPLHLLRAMLSFLPWDASHSVGSGCLGLVVELAHQMVRLLLYPKPSHPGYSSCQLYSQTMSTALAVLKLTSDCLDHTYSLQQRTCWDSTQQESVSQPPQLWPSDRYSIPLLKKEKEGKTSLLHQAMPVPQRPSNRLLGVWQWMYKITQQYMEELKGFIGCDGWEKEQDRVCAILSQIQTALQCTGKRLEEGPALLSYPGEYYFLFGSYSKSTAAWRSEMWAKKKKCNRSVFQEIRLYLALLYGFLFRYQLREAQGLGDHMARLILHRAGEQHDQENNMTSTKAQDLFGSWLPVDLCTEAAFAVVQTLGRFMASYFTNQPIYILPPHSVDVLPPLHLSHVPSLGRLVPLCQEGITRAVRGQQLSELWTVDYALDLLLLGGLLPEAVWLANCLGDWKAAASMSLAYTSYSTEHFDFTRLKCRELHLPPALEPGSIFQFQLESLLTRKVGTKETEQDKSKSFTGSLEGEDLELLQISVQEILKAAVMADVDVISLPLSALLDSAKDLASSLPALVPTELYLPSPPLYCPQTAPNTQDPVGTFEKLSEIASRHKVSRVLQRLLLLLRSAHCCRPAAQWYTSHLRHARHLQHKIKQRYSRPYAAQEERVFPEGLMKFITQFGSFRRGPDIDSQLDPFSIRTIVCFRELCGLCWMLHVRDQLSLSCRKYQAARHYGGDGQKPGDSEVTILCLDALLWACRFLPFSHFLNIEEILQDILLSLMSELPPISMVAETLVRAFPQEEESVRVSLREKYSSLLQRLRHCTVLDGEKEEKTEMMILIRDKLRQRRKNLLCLKRHLAPPEIYLWEREEEEEDREGSQKTAMVGQLSVGASQSNNTLTDYGHPLVYSDGDTAENISEALSPDLPCRTLTSSKRVQDRVQDGVIARRKTVGMNKLIQEESDSGSGPDKEPKVKCNMEEPSLPLVGTWEFELEDEEYLVFLELFLSYILEKDGPDGGDSGCELPLLKGFSSQLRERELHSSAFDVLTTLRRRQKDGRNPTRRHGACDAPKFRAGCCFKPIQEGTTPEDQTSPVWCEAPISKPSISVDSLPGLSAGKGLFGLRRQPSLAPESKTRGGHLATEVSRPCSAVFCQQPIELLPFGFLASTDSLMELHQNLDPKLDAEFPEVGRLLEWMGRWADRKVLLRNHNKKKEKQRGAGDGRTSVGGVVIRVKATAPAVLTALSLLERRYASALLGNDYYCAHVQVRETQWTVAPVLQPGVGWKHETVSSVNTGYPGSANTPITPDQNAEQEPTFGCHTSELETGISLKPLQDNQEQVSFDSDIGTTSSQQSSLHIIEVSPEIEDHSSGSEGLRMASSRSVEQISGPLCSPELVFKPPDLSCSDNNEVISTAIFQSCNGSADSEVPPQFDPSSLPIVDSVPGTHTELSSPTRLQLHDSTTKDFPGLQPTSSPATAPTVVSSASNQQSTTLTDSVRHRMNDELFRLVQLQHMSLMHMMGPSFANFHSVQLNTFLAQPNLRPSNVDVPSSPNSTSFPSQQNILPSHTNMSVQPERQAVFPLAGSDKSFSNPAPEYSHTDQPLNQSTVKISPARSLEPPPRNLHTTVSNVTVNSQEMQPLSVQAESQGNPTGEIQKSIPSSQGLLTTIDRTVPISSTPLAMLTGGNSEHIPTCQSSGIKLLQLCPPLLPHLQATSYSSVQEAWGPQAENTGTTSPDHPDLKQWDQIALNKAEKEVTPRESSILPRHLSTSLNTNIPHHLVSRNTQPQTHKSGPHLEQSKRPEFPLLLSVLPAHRPPSAQGLHLKHPYSMPQSSTILPQLYSPPSNRPSTDIVVPVGDTSSIRLLHIDPEPQMMLPLAAPQNQKTCHIPVEVLTGLSVGRQNAEEAGLQLLRADLLTSSSNKAIPSISSNMSKRQRRRDKTRKTGEREEVTFRRNESIILTEEPTDLAVNEEPVTEDEVATVEQGFVLPLGSSDSLLTGQRLLDQAVSTSAELHAFASTQKRPPLRHDASTNTDPNKALPAKAPEIPISLESQSTASVPPSNLLLNHQFSEEPPVQNTEEISQQEEKIWVLEGRQFINVTDLEGQALSQELPSCLSPTTQDILVSLPSSPTSAQLHLIAATVCNAAPTASYTSDTVTENGLKTLMHPGLDEKSSLPTHTEPKGDPVTVTLLYGKASPSESFGVQKTPSPGSCSAFSVAPTAQFSARLSEMDAQLTVLQNIADHMEIEFANSRKLVNTIETLSPFLTPDVEDTLALNKTVSISVPEKVWRPQSFTLTQSNAHRKDEEKQEENHAVHSDHSISERQPTFLSPQSATTRRTSPFSLHTPLKMKGPSAEAAGTSGILGCKTSGLNDTADILWELVREGALSPTDLELSHSETVNLSWQDPQQRRCTLQRPILSGDERRQSRMWMRRERTADYHKQRPGLRQKEYRPYAVCVPSKSTHKSKSAIGKLKKEKDKVTLLEQYNRRTHEACALISDPPPRPVNLRSLSQAKHSPAPSSTRPSTAQTSESVNRICTGSADENRRCPKFRSEQAGLHFCPQANSKKKKSHFSLESDLGRFGLHRPVSSLPRDRLSQVTRRGMLSVMKNKIKPHTTNQVEERQHIHSETMDLSKYPSGSSVQRRAVKSELWEGIAGLLDDQEDGARAAATGMDWLEDLSGSASTSLDWAAVESMLASEGAV
ncbi:ciliogenesis and planar polarity effector 1 isoform X2 [Lampris incognitus]|uniref:ciliogenesis and planar polarity effector 1 isoform X2 n=1 Tax=Lampris incognitus TaxID=2546036 RepID=UPI0024B50B20|nr:ciliogenesis and planar polarity effector 1 isoform X2 [Lampris incognitus]